MFLQSEPEASPVPAEEICPVPRQLTQAGVEDVSGQYLIALGRASDKNFFPSLDAPAPKKYIDTNTLATRQVFYLSPGDRLMMR